MTSIRLVLALFAAMDLESGQMDVVTAFLNGELQEEIYVEIPQGLKTTENENYVRKLKKAVYGLKQAPDNRTRKYITTLFKPWDSRAVTMILACMLDTSFQTLL